MREPRLAGDVVRLLRDHGPQTKADLALAVGLPRTTVSAAVRRLAADKLVEDGHLAPSSGGRRSTTVRLAAGRTFVAVSIGERRVRVATTSGHLTITGGVSIDRVEHGDVERVAGEIAGAVDEVLGARVPDAMAVAVVEGADPLLAETLRLLADRYDAPVGVTPASRAMVLGERHSGAFPGLADLVALRLGNGVTAATVSDGRMVTGAAGRAGEVGHVRVEEFGPVCACGRTGCLDAYAGAPAVIAQATELARRGRSHRLAAALEQEGALTLADVVAAAHAGDPATVQLARDVGQRLGQVLAGLLAHVSPGGVVVGGPVAALGPYFLGDLRATTYRLAPPSVTADVEIVVSELGERAVLIGTGARAVDDWITGFGVDEGREPGPTSDRIGQNESSAGRMSQIDPFE